MIITFFLLKNQLYDQKLFFKHLYKIGFVLIFCVKILKYLFLI
ncbi:hypothetical protein LEP1GSC059_1228 [Leptospira noguchii serovar Panama str. CZ214]|uniref:Uncharacterized protein n=1 Tax=Leptospira noguchii serovar Panama str. CZ214 TaxID=1001595 RepID=T0FM19_9LEPT|nr:hypothetical protein LEP1GSC059_1228 [Leptospira noguchii serovar Panama str. CZ214]